MKQQKGNINHPYLYFGMGVDGPVQISTCWKQFMDAQVCSYQRDTTSHISVLL